MRLSHARRAVGVRFDDPNLVSCARLVPVMALADRCGLTALLVEHVKIAAKGGVNAAAKILALVAGMVCGADSIQDMDLLRHGGMPRLFDQIRAPSRTRRSRRQPLAAGQTSRPTAAATGRNYAAAPAADAGGPPPRR